MEKLIKGLHAFQTDYFSSRRELFERLGRGEPRLHGWSHRFETGEVLAYDPPEGQFTPLTTAGVQASERRVDALAPHI